jgi:hypothetical protein
MGGLFKFIIKGMMGNPQAFWDRANYLLVKQRDVSENKYG